MDILYSESFSMHKYKNLTSKIIPLKQDSKPSSKTVDMLKRAWNQLPSDFTMGERSLFIELAERIIKVSDSRSDEVN